MPHLRRAATVAVALLVSSGAAVAIGPVAGAADRTPPSTPGGLRVTGTTDHTVGLAWTPSRDNTSGRLSYRLVIDGGWRGNVVGPAHTEHGLTRNTTYTFQLQAQDAAGNVSSLSGAVRATTDVGDAAAPTAPPNVRVTQTTFDTVSLAWDPATDDSGPVDFYPVFVDGRWSSGSYGSSVTLQGLTHGTSYRIEVFALDSEGNWSAPSGTSAATVADAEPPTTPADLRTSSGGAALVWGASTDNRGVGFYQLFADGVAVSATTNTAVDFLRLTDIECVLNHGQTYTFTVRASDRSGLMSQHSNPVTVRVP